MELYLCNYSGTNLIVWEDSIYSFHAAAKKFIEYILNITGLYPEFVYLETKIIENPKGVTTTFYIVVDGVNGIRKFNIVRIPKTYEVKKLNDITRG